MPHNEVEQFLEEEGDTVDFDPWGSRTKSPSSFRSVEGGKWRRPKKCPKQKWSSSSRSKEM